MRKQLIALACVTVLVAAACGGDDSADPNSSQVGISSSDETTTTSAQSEEPAASAAGSGDRSATLTLDNGEVFVFSILCALEPQESAGSEILFTVVSYDEPNNLDVTQFGENSFDGAASIGVYDSTTYDTLWEANTIYGGEVTLSLNRSSVTGSGDFHEAGDITSTAVHGELVANC